MQELRVFGAELTVYDVHKKCLLTDGEYELVLQDLCCDGQEADVTLTERGVELPGEEEDEEGDADPQAVWETVSSDKVRQVLIANPCVNTLKMCGNHVRICVL